MTSVAFQFLSQVVLHWHGRVWVNNWRDVIRAYSLLLLRVCKHPGSCGKKTSTVSQLCVNPLCTGLSICKRFAEITQENTPEYVMATSGIQYFIYV